MSARVRAAMLVAAMALPYAGGCAQPKSRPSMQYDQAQTVQDPNWQLGMDRQPSPRTLLAMSRVLSAQGRTAEAAFILQRVIRECPTAAAAYTDLAELHMRQQDAASAAEVLGTGLSVLGEDPVLLNNMGFVQLARKEPAKALAHFQRAVAACPTQPRYQANVALALAMLGRYEEALVGYEQVLSASEAHHNVAVVCDSRGDKDRAKTEFARALLLRGEKNDGRPCRFHVVAISAVTSRPAATQPVDDGPAQAMSPASVER